MEIRVYLDNKPSANTTPFRIYDNGLRVGELIGDEWRSYERLYVNGPVELRKILDSDPELHYWSIEDTTYTNGMFLQWPLGSKIPPEVPAHLHSEIEKLHAPVEIEQKVKIKRTERPATHYHHGAKKSRQFDKCLIQM